MAKKAAKKAALKKRRSYSEHHRSSPVWDKVDDQLKERIGALPAARKPLRDRALQIADLLREEFPEARCALDHENPLQLLVATILSAQCTDARVNEVTPGLFRKYRTAADFAASPEGELEGIIRSTGFFNSKAKAIREACADIEAKHGGEVPEEMEALLELRGVARKTASVVRTNCFGYPGLTVDTHFKRIANRLGLTSNDDPEKIEADVANILPPERWRHFTHAIILHGRKTCQARKPKCGACRLFGLCPSAGTFE